MSEIEPQNESEFLAPQRMTPEEAIQRAFSEMEPAACPKCGTLIKGFALVGYNGEVLCPNCGSNVTQKHSS